MNEQKGEYYVNICGRLRGWGRFTGEIIIFLRAVEELFMLAPKTDRGGCLGLISIGGAAV